MKENDTLKSLANLLQALADRTATGMLQWQSKEDGGYSSANELFLLDWLYWYRADGITLGSSGLLLQIFDTVFPLLPGEALLDLGYNLVTKVDRQTTLPQRIQSGCNTLTGAASMEPQVHNSTHQSIKQLLVYLSALTKQRKVFWIYDADKQEYFSTDDTTSCEFRFRDAVANGGTIIEGAILEICLPKATFGLVFGTDLFSLAEELLALSCREMRNRIDSRNAALKTAFEELTKLTG